MAISLQTAEDIPEDQYGFTPAEGTRSIARALVHIALSPKLHLEIHAGERRTSFEGLDFPALMKRLGEEEARDRTKVQVVDLLKTEGETWASFLEGVSEDFLAEAFTMPPGATPATKSRLEMLLSIKEHEMHHRAQLMVAQRSGPRKLDSGLSEISIVFQAAVPRPVAPKYTTSGVRRPSELCRRRPL